jgi:tetratricopeptide (TPR) repeat protein
MSGDQILRSLGALAFGLGAFTALRLGAAEILFEQDTVSSLKRAVSLQASFPEEAVAQRLSDLDPADAASYLNQIVRSINPRSSAAWIALGIGEEARGNHASAENDLRRAVAVDHQFEPAWTLANFYFRRGRRDAFWHWADRAVDLSVDRLAYSDLAPLLQLASGFESDPEKMLAHFSNAARLRPAYLNFLMAIGRLDAAHKVALDLTVDPATAPHLIDLADRQIHAGTPLAAIEVWNASSGLGRLDPGQDLVLSNGDLMRAPLNLGFDWRLMGGEGVEAGWKPSALDFHLSGSQPERCILLEQTIFLPPKRFRLHFDYKTGASPLRGLRWSLDDSISAEIPFTERWTEGIFDLPPMRGLHSLRLLYRREPGTTRAEGRIEIRNLRLNPVAGENP